MVTLIDSERPGRFSRWDSDNYFKDIRYELDLFRYHMAHSFISRSAFTNSLRELWRTTAKLQQMHDFPSDADVTKYFRLHFPVFHLKDDLQRWGYVSREPGVKGTDVYLLRDLALALKDTRSTESNLEHNYKLSQNEFRLLFHVVLSRIISSSITKHFFGSCSACDDEDYLNQFESSLWGGAIQIQWIYFPTWRMVDVCELFFKTRGSKSETHPISESMARRICKTLEEPYLRSYLSLDSGSSASDETRHSRFRSPPTGALLLFDSPMPAIDFLSIHDV